MNYLRRSGIYKILIALLLIFSFYQCMHDEFEFDKLSDEMEVNMGLMTPLAYGTLSLNDIISQFDSTSYIDTYEDGLLYITYEDSLLSFIAEDLLEVPDQDFFEYFIESDYDFPPYINWGDTLPIEREENFAFTFSNNEKLDSIILETGNMNLNINSSFEHTGKVILTSQFIRDSQGKPFSDTVIISDPSGTFSASEVISLDNHVIELQDTTASDTTYLPFNFELILYNSGAGITAGDEVEITATFTDLGFSAIFGYIGNYELLTETGEIDLSFFENTLDGDIEFENPQLNFTISNSYGLPAEVDIMRFTGFNGDEDSIPLDFDSGVNPFRYAYPTINEYNETKDTVISITGNNSTLSEFLAFFPTRLEYNMKALSNPDGPEASYNFVTDNSRIDVDFEFILPMWFKADSFALEDTIDLDLSNMEENADFIEKVNLMLEVYNGLPLDIDFQLYFLDENYNAVDTMFAEDFRPVISSGIIDATEGTVIAPGFKRSWVEFSNTEIRNLATVRFGRIRAGLKTPSDSDDELLSVKFYTDYKVDFNLSVDIDVKANSNDF